MESLIAIAIATLVIWFALYSRRDKAAASTRHYNQAVVGESFYQGAISKIVREKGREVSAHLELEDDNVFDRKAVKVTIRGLTVGHLSRADARKFRKTYGRNITCDALITGGREDAPTYGVQLDIDI